MIKINKTIEHATLTQYRASISKKNLLDETIYEDFEDKGKEACENKKIGNLRLKLLEDQGFVCCYCMSQISCKNSKIEHFKPQSKFRELQIKYTNLFISCNGNTQGQEHCDTKKANTELRNINLLSTIENKITYTTSGKIESNIHDLDNALNKVLNLNTKILKDNRREAYSTLIILLSKKNSSKRWSKELLQKYIRKYESKTVEEKFAPYYSMLLYFLRKKLIKIKN